MSVIASIPPVVIPLKASRGRDKPLLSLRLSDGYSWAHEFGASSPTDLKDGCFEAFVALSIEWNRRGRNTSTRPGSLQLHVLDDVTAIHSWINASYGTRSDRMIIVRSPGTATNGEDWDSAPWEKYWLCCLRCWNACYLLNQFCSTVIERLDVADEIRRKLEGGGLTA